MPAELWFLRPLVLTVLFELAGAYLCGIRRRRCLGVVVLVNVITNPLLQIVSGLLSRILSGGVLKAVMYLVLEPLIVLAEGWVYHRTITHDHPYRLSLILNVISIAGGFLWKTLFGF